MRQKWSCGKKIAHLHFDLPNMTYQPMGGGEGGEGFDDADDTCLHVYKRINTTGHYQSYKIMLLSPNVNSLMFQNCCDYLCFRIFVNICVTNHSQAEQNAKTSQKHFLNQKTSSAAG